MKKIFVALSMVAFLAACDDSSSASVENNGPTTLSSAEEQGSSSSSSVTSTGSVTTSSSLLNGVDELSRSSSSEQNAESSSSSADEMASSSSGSDVPQSYAEAKVMPSGTYDCTKYKCVTTEYLNQEILEAGKYGEILDQRDGQVYKTVQIGDQVWMAQNLNLETENSWCGGGSGKTEGDCAIYGRFYTWAAAMGKFEDECGRGYDCTTLGSGNVQGICLSGWHLPDTTEWRALFDAVGGSSTASQKLKSQTGWIPYGGITYENVYGFSVLPAAHRYIDGNFGNSGVFAKFWSALQYDSNNAYYTYLDYIFDGAYRDYYDFKEYGISVRCVKD